MFLLGAHWALVGRDGARRDGTVDDVEVASVDVVVVVEGQHALGAADGRATVRLVEVI